MGHAHLTNKALSNDTKVNYLDLYATVVFFFYLMPKKRGRRLLEGLVFHKHILLNNVTYGTLMWFLL